ncbi:MAG: hypothetical protein FJX74_05880 [Armatimonadetes bacterium]|nr:hypothetical protein [Armatimonadota bacterium]
MKRLILIAAMVVLALAVTAVGVLAQGPGSGRGARWANLSPEDAQKIADLHQKVRQAQWDLWSLQTGKAEEKRVEQKRAEVLRLRGELAKLMTDLPAGPCFQAGNATPPPGAGLGLGRGIVRGPCGMGGGFGRGAGRGMGYGRGAGMCLRW